MMMMMMKKRNLKEEEMKYIVGIFMAPVEKKENDIQSHECRR